MGLSENLCTLALAPLLRAAADHAADGLGTRLAERLAVPADRLAVLLREACEGAWLAVECYLAGDALHKLCDQATISGPDDEAFRAQVRRFLEAFPLDASLRADTPQVRRCLLEFSAAEAEGILTAPLDASLLLGEMNRLLPTSGSAFREETRRLVAGMGQALTEAGYPALAALFAARASDDVPLAVLAAQTFLRLGIERDPVALGEVRAAGEGQARQRERGLVALDAVLLLQQSRLRQWLERIERDNGISPPDEPLLPDVRLSGEPQPPTAEQRVPSGRRDAILAEIRRLLDQLQQLPTPVRETTLDIDDFDDIDDDDIDDDDIDDDDFDDDVDLDDSGYHLSLEDEGERSGEFKTEELPPAPMSAATPMKLPPAPGAVLVSRAMLARDEVATGGMEPAPPRVKQDLKRRATLRWYRRMNPQRMYPLTVVLAKGRVKEVRVKDVAQTVAKDMLVIPESSPCLVVRPVLPGVLCYPPEQTVDVTPDLVTVRFRVVPQMLGEVPDARVEFYWRERLISEVPLPTKVARQTVAAVVSVAGLLWPMLGSTVKTLGYDADSKDVVLKGLASYLALPYAIEAGLALSALLALILYLWNRPRENDAETDVLAVRPMSLEELLTAGREAVLLERWEVAVGYYEDAVNVAPHDALARAGLESCRQRLAAANS